MRLPLALFVLVVNGCSVATTPTATANGCGTIYDVVATCCPGWCGQTSKATQNFAAADPVFNACTDAIGCTGGTYHDRAIYTCQPCP